MGFCPARWPFGPFWLPPLTSVDRFDPPLVLYSSCTQRRNFFRSEMYDIVLTTQPGRCLNAHGGVADRTNCRVIVAASLQFLTHMPCLRINSDIAGDTTPSDTNRQPRRGQTLASKCGRLPHVFLAPEHPSCCTHEVGSGFRPRQYVPFRFVVRAAHDAEQPAPPPRNSGWTL